MSLLMFEGWRFHSAAELGELYTITGTISPALDSQRRSDCYGFTGTSVSVEYPFSITARRTPEGDRTQRIIVGFSVKWDGTVDGGTNVHEVFTLTTSLTTMTLAIKDDGYLQLRQGVTVEATATEYPLVADSTYYIEAECVITTTDGGMRVWIDTDNETYQLALNSSKLTNFGDATDTDVFQSITLRTPASANCIIGGDLYLLDPDNNQPPNYKLGSRVRIESSVPSDVGQNEFTPSTGSRPTANPSCVDDASSNGDTDYVYAIAGGAVETYRFPAITGSPVPNGFVGCITHSVARKVEVTRAQIEHMQQELGSNSSSFAEFTLTQSYTVQRAMWTNVLFAGYYQDEQAKKYRATTSAEFNAIRYGIRIYT